MMFGAGAVSGLLGIGSGALKVLAMDHAMRIPFKVSTSTTNFMIGITAAASAGVYLNRGYIDPVLAMPVMLGVSAGSLFGARHLSGAETRVLRIVFGVVVGVLAVKMIYRGLSGNFAPTPVQFTNTSERFDVPEQRLRSPVFHGIHLAMRARDNVSHGMSPDEAERDARRRFGNLASEKERTRDAGIFFATRIGS